MATLLDVTRAGSSHNHRLTVSEVGDERGSEIYIEVSEPGSCGCTKRIALSELAHLLLNLREQELWTIPNRDEDAGGHAHVT